MPVDAPTRLAFDDVLIDFAACRVLRGGVEQPLEPKAFAVLAFLAREPGRVHARDAILDAVWGHRHVTPGVLNRVMTLLRHALGEDAQHPHRLHTVHGVGYRFDLPDRAASSADPRRRRASDRFPRRAWGLAAGGIAVLGLLAVFGPFASWRAAAPTVAAAPDARAVPTLMLSPLKAIGSSDAAAVIADGLSEELIGALAQIDGLRVIARETTLLAVAASDDPVRWAAQAGITHALEGSLQLDGQRLRVRLRLVEASGGRAVWAREFDRDTSQVLALQHEIADQVATSLALRMGLRPAPGESGDVGFLRRYHAARAQLSRRDVSVERSIEPAEVELRALLRERPDDARVHATLARVLEARASRRPALTDELQREAQALAALALRLDPTLAEAKHVLAREACRGNDWRRCIALLREAKALGPDLTALRFDLAVAWARLGYLDRAEAEVREALARDPLSTALPFLLGRVLDTLGRHDEARRSFDRDPEIGGVYGRWFNAVWRGAPDEALAIAEREMVAGGDADLHLADLQPSYLAVSQALVDPARWPDARRVMDDWERGAMGRMAFHRVLDPAADPNALVEGLAAARRRAYSSWDLLLWTAPLAALRQQPAFQRYVRDDGLLAYWQAEGFPAQCRPARAGDVDGVRCD